MILCSNTSLFSHDKMYSNDNEIKIKEPSNIFRIEVARSTYTDESVVAFFAAASDAYDAYDSDKMFSPDNNYPQTYTLTSDAAIVAINGESELTSGVERIIPLGFKAAIADNFIFTATNLASFDATISVYLEDKQLNILQDLRSDNTYDFSSGIVNNATRFSLHFITPTSIILNNWTGGTSTDWSDVLNWSTNSTPTSSENVYISSVPANQPHITSSIFSPSLCRDLNIYSGATLTIDAAKALTIGGKLSNEGVFIIESNASGTGSFIDNENISGSGTFNVKKYLTNGRWWYLGSPMNDATAASFGVLSAIPNTGIRLFNWDETSGIYNSITNGSDPLAVLTGFTYKDFGGLPQTAVFTGTLNSGIVGSADNLSHTVAGTFDGYNLVCNPFPSAIDVGLSSSPTPGMTMSGLDPTFWFRNDGTYATYNWTTGIGSPVTTTSEIPAMQAFWLHVSAAGTGTFSFDNQARIHSSHSFYKNTESSNIFRIEVKRDSLTDEAVVAFFASASDNFDIYDSEKMFSPDANYPQIYTLTSDSTIVVINGESEIINGEVRIIPMGFVSYVSGSFELQATNLNEFDSNIPVFLEDAMLDSIQDLRISDIYSFTSGNVNNADRFRLHFGSIATGIKDNEITLANAYAFENTIYLITPETSSVELYDLLGNLIISKTCAPGLNVLQNNAARGIYLVKVYNANNVCAEKVYIQ